MKFADALAEGILNRLVRAQVIKGSAQREKGKLIHQIRIENASPLILNGLALVGTGEQGRRSAQGAVGHRDSAGPEHARSHER